MECRTSLRMFEAMYANEDEEGFDSWHQDEQANLIQTQLALTIINRYDQLYHFHTVLDMGCGKGVFTAMLKRPDNDIFAIDISATAIDKAKVRYPDIDFKAIDIEHWIKEDYHPPYTLVVMKGVLEFLFKWKAVIQYVSNNAPYIYIQEHFPHNPIGSIKGPEELVHLVEKYYHILTNIYIIHDRQLLLFGVTSVKPYNSNQPNLTKRTRKV